MRVGLEEARKGLLAVISVAMTHETRVQLVKGRTMLGHRWSAWSLSVEQHPVLLFTLPAAVVVFVLMVFPVFYTLYMSLHSWFASSLTAPEFIGLRNFKRAFTQDERFRNAIWLTFYFTALATALELVLGVALALLLNRPFRGKGFFRSIFLLPMVATPVAIALVWVMMYNPTLGVMNYIVGLVGLGPYKWVSDARLVIPALVVVDTWQWTPLITLITLAGLATLPLEPYESALIDGATPAQMFWRITLPLLRPTIMVALLFRSIDCLKTFDIIYTMTGGGPAYASETLNVYTFQVGLFYFHIGYACSLMVILFALVLGVSLVLIKVRRGAW
jgi:multiple sugar transport system permease protein